MNRLSKVSQIISGALIGVFLFFGGISFLAYAIFYKMSVTPSKPVFFEENSHDKSSNKSITNNKTNIS